MRIEAAAAAASPASQSHWTESDCDDSGYPLHLGIVTIRGNVNTAVRGASGWSGYPDSGSIEILSFYRQRGSVVRTSVFGWRTFPGLRLIYGWHVTTSWVRCLLWVNQQANSAFHPFGVGRWVVIHAVTWITGVKTIKRQTRLCMAGWSLVSLRAQA